MQQSLVQLYTQIIFSTIDRNPFLHDKSFRERLMATHLEESEKAMSEIPLNDPKCGQSMRRQKSPGDFWGCTTYPDCKGTRPV